MTTNDLRTHLESLPDSFVLTFEVPDHEGDAHQYLCHAGLMKALLKTVETGEPHDYVPLEVWQSTEDDPFPY